MSALVATKKRMSHKRSDSRGELPPEVPDNTRAASQPGPPSALEESAAAQQMRVFSRHLRRHADLIEYFASVQPALGNPPLRILAGNFYFNLRGIGDWMSKQLFRQALRIVKRPSPEKQEIILGGIKRLLELESDVPPPRSSKNQE